MYWQWIFLQTDKLKFPYFEGFVLIEGDSSMKNKQSTILEILIQIQRE